VYVPDPARIAISPHIIVMSDMSIVAKHVVKGCQTLVMDPTREIAILAGTVMDTLNTVGATYLKNGPKPKTTTQKNNDHDKPPYYPPPTALFLSIYTPVASDRWHDG